MNHTLNKLSVTSNKYGRIPCSIETIDESSPPLFVDTHDVLALEASGSFGSFHLHEFKNEDYCLRYDTYNFSEDLRLSACADIQFLGLQFVLKNHLRTTVKGLKSEIMRTNEFNMMYVPQVESEYSFLKSQEYVNFGLIFTPDYLQRCSEAFPYLDEFLKRVSRKVPSLLSERNPCLNPEMTLAIESILRCGYNGTLKKMYLDSKVHELLLLSLENITSFSEVPVCIRKEDIEKIHQAREYLLAHIDGPCTIKDLAREVGLNDFKIKKGFKQVYNNSVLGVLLEERMQKARTLLLENQHSIHEIATLTGYKSLSNFTIAFKRKFGYPPSALKH